MANPIEMKKTLLSMSFKDITKKFFELNFAKYYDPKTEKMIDEKYNINAKIELKPNEYHNPVKLTTTLGRLLVNKYLFEDGLIDFIGYHNEPFTKKLIEKIDEKISNAVLDKRIDVMTVTRYYDRLQWIGMTLHAIVTGSFSERTIAPLPEVMALKDELFKKYADELKGPNGVIYANKIESLLLEEAKKVLKDDPGMDLYNSGARGSFSNNYKNMMVIRGPVWNNVTKRFDVLKNAFSEGISKDEIPSYGSQVVSGAYPKAVGTAVSGYYTKKFFAVYQSSVLDEQGSDCGSTSYRNYFLTESNYKNVKYRWIKDGNKLVCLTPNVYKKYINSTVKMRSPLYCCGERLCSKCAGDLPYRMGIENIGLTVADISTSFLNKKMKAFHNSVISIHNIKIEEMFL